MDVRLFPDGRAFVRDQTLPIEGVTVDDEGSFIIPLNKEQVDINSIQIRGLNDVVYLSTHPLSVVTKGDDTYVGTLVNFTDEYAVVSQGRIRTVVRNYDNIVDAQYITGRTASRNIPSTVQLSYLTSGINANVVHSISIDTLQLESDLVVDNNTFNDLVDAQFEVISAEQVMQRYSSERVSLQMSNAVSAAPRDSSAGTIYVVNGTYDVPAGFNTSIPLIRNDVDASVVYVIDAPNGQQNATYTLHWTSPADLPPGSLYVYRGGNLEAVSNISPTGEGQTRDIPLLVVPSVYARGTISRTDSHPVPIIIQGQNNNGARTVQVPIDNVLDERRTTTANVILNGTITNSLSEQITAVLRYYIGDAKVNVSSNFNAQREDSYILFRFSLGPNSSQQYNIPFVLTY